MSSLQVKRLASEVSTLNNKVTKLELELHKMNKNLSKLGRVIDWFETKYNQVRNFLQNLVKRIS